MRRKYGIILLDPFTAVLRIYETDMKAWKLIHYKSITLEYTEDNKIIEAVGELIMDHSTHKITEWKLAARNLPYDRIKLIATKVNLSIENLTHLREQELISKGMFTELW